MKLLQSLTRGLQALDYMAEQGMPVRLTDVADALGVRKPNASHLLKALVAAGYAEQDTSRHYRVAAKIRARGRHEHSLEEIVACKEAWRSALQDLVAQTGECAHLAVLVKTRVWYVDKVDSTHQLKVDHPIGSLSPLHCTALGKTFLAFGGAEPEDPLTRHTPKTITSLARLREEVRLTQARGFAIDSEEYAQGIRCVAGPIFDAQGSMIAALGVSGPTVRVTNDRLFELGRIVSEISGRSLSETV